MLQESGESVSRREWALVSDATERIKHSMNKKEYETNEYINHSYKELDCKG